MFNENYDMSLGLMLEGSKNKREIIIDFLKEIPLELLNQMYKSFDEYQEYLDRNKNIYFLDRENINLSGKYITKGDMVYWYNIDSWTGILDIGKGVCCLGEEIDVFQMTLYPFNELEYSKMQMFDETVLGEIFYNFVEEIIDDKLCSVHSDSMDFTLIKVALCSVVRARDDADVIKIRYSIVNINNISDILNINTLQQNRLVRRRKK